MEHTKITEQQGKSPLEDKFCLLFGHRQNGKTTIAYPTEQLIKIIALMKFM